MAAPSFYLLVCRCCNVSLTHSLLSGSVYLVVVSFFVLSLLIFFGLRAFCLSLSACFGFSQHLPDVSHRVFLPVLLCTHTHAHTHTHTRTEGCAVIHVIVLYPVLLFFRTPPSNSGAPPAALSRKRQTSGLPFGSVRKISCAKFSHFGKLIAARTQKFGVKANG